MAEWIDIIKDKEVITGEKLKLAVLNGVFTGTVTAPIEDYKKAITKGYLTNNYQNVNYDKTTPTLVAKSLNQVLVKRDIRPNWADPMYPNEPNQRPRFNDRVTTSLIMPNGALLVGGFFTIHDDCSRNRIAIIDTINSNSANEGFTETDISSNIGSGFNNNVYKIIRLSTGKYLVGGSFTSYNGNTCNRIARLNSDLSFDSTFNVGGGGFDNTVLTMTEAPDGKILIGGSFLTYNGVTSQRLTRINPDGSIDSSAASAINNRFISNSVTTIKVLSNGEILVGGNFVYRYQDVFQTIDVPTFLRMNSNFQSLSTNSGIGGGVITKIDTQSTGKIIISGNFGVAQFGSTIYKQLIRLNTDFTQDYSFAPTGGGYQFNGDINDFIIVSNDLTLVVGSFTSYNGFSSGTGFVRFGAINNDGSFGGFLYNDIYTQRKYGVNNNAFTICSSPQGFFYIGGDFTEATWYKYNKIAQFIRDFSGSFFITTGF